MQSAIDVIKDTYDYETLKEIVEYGCESGVCHEHIYYGDTISFFETYEDEIVEYLADACGDGINEELWMSNTCNYAEYQNATVWAFIELVAALAVDEKEEQELKDDETIGNYMKEEISNYGYTKKDLNGYNPERSMNPNRYQNV